MQLSNYYSEANGSISFTRQHASDFAKGVADDFNPIHDIDAKRFCVPGDLLFAVALSKLGLSEKIHVKFSDMVSEDIALSFNTLDTGVFDVVDTNKKVYLNLTLSGNKTLEQEPISRLINEYVAFSGKTFPHVLVPLWKSKNVMVNPARPLVIYESMSIDMTSLEFTEPSLEYTGSTLEVDGKRGNVSLQFIFKEGDRILGKGEKRMILSGLKEYDQPAIDELIIFYNDRKEQLKVS
jgi:hypothetical protein